MLLYYSKRKWNSINEYRGYLMDIVVTKVTEHEDGSATLEIDMDNEVLTALLQSALLDAIKKGLEIQE